MNWSVGTHVCLYFSVICYLSSSTRRAGTVTICYLSSRYTRRASTVTICYLSSRYTRRASTVTICYLSSRYTRRDGTVMICYLSSRYTRRAGVMPAENSYPQRTLVMLRGNAQVSGNVNKQEKFDLYEFTLIFRN